MVHASAGIQVAWRRVDAGVPRREVAYALLRELAGAPNAPITQTCPTCGGPHGPVTLSGGAVRASVAYARARASREVVAVVAVAPAATTMLLGVDAEFAVDPIRDAVGVGEVLGRPTAGIRDWVRVEAVLKATGQGLRTDPSAVRVATRARDWSAAVPGFAPVSGIDVTGIPGVIVAVATSPPNHSESARIMPLQDVIRHRGE